MNFKGLIMDTERMIRELRRLAEEHKNDMVFTGETRWSWLCSDVANRLEMLENYHDNLYACVQKALGEERYNDARSKLVDGGSYSSHAVLCLAIEKLREEAGDFD